MAAETNDDELKSLIKNFKELQNEHIKLQKKYLKLQDEHIKLLQKEYNNLLYKNN